MGVRPCLRSSRAISFSLSPERLPVRTLPSLATARKKKVAIRAPRNTATNEADDSPQRRRGHRDKRRENRRDNRAHFHGLLCVFLCVLCASAVNVLSPSEFLRHPH